MAGSRSRLIKLGLTCQLDDASSSMARFLIFDSGKGEVKSQPTFFPSVKIRTQKNKNSQQGREEKRRSCSFPLLFFSYFFSPLSLGYVKLRVFLPLSVDAMQ